MAVLRRPNDISAVYATLGLGSNLGDAAVNVERAIAMIGQSGGIKIVARSKLYKTPPWGVLDQNWFVNGCIAIETSLVPRGLLELCQSVENEMGRVRARRWGERIIDVDILTYGNLEVSEPDLKIPHPLIAERDFVLVPLAEIAPLLMIGTKTVSELKQQIDVSFVAVLDAEPSKH